MPIYEYLCQNCGHAFEEMQTMKEEPLVKCPKCGKNTLKKLIGAGTSIIFKGSGFYINDYKKKNLTESKTPHKKTGEKEIPARESGGKESKETTEGKDTKETKSKDTKKDKKTDSHDKK
jgi:putative FmdB family regulatory protein